MTARLDRKQNLADYYIYIYLAQSYSRTLVIVFFGGWAGKKKKHSQSCSVIQQFSVSIYNHYVVGELM